MSAEHPVQLLGAVAVGGVTLQPGRVTSLFCLLALAGGSVVSSEQLMSELWNDDVPDSGVSALHVAVSRLRKQVSAAAISIDARSPGYTMTNAASDVAAFERLAAATDRHAAAGEVDAVASVAREALALWGGTPFVGATETPALERARNRLRGRHTQLRRMLAEALLTSGGPAQVAQAADLAGDLVADDPLDEAAVAVVMRAAVARNRVADAVAAFDEYRRQMRDELGLDPSGALRELHTGILRADSPSPDSPRPVSPRPSSPTAHEPQGDPTRAVAAAATAAPQPRETTPRASDDNDTLVGRRAERAALLDAIDVLGRVIVLEGEPGIGKSALARFAAELARARGMTVVWARASDGPGTPPLWLWEQALGELSAVADRERSAGSAIIRELADEAGDVTSRFRLAESIAGRVLAASEHEPVLLVLDDVQWADEGSLQVLLLLAQRVRGRPLVLVLTARTGSSRTASLDSALGALAREDGVTRAVLRPFSLIEVQEVAKRAGAAEPAAQLLLRSGGNPFYLGELLLAGVGRVPSTVSELLVQRLSVFTETTVAILRSAAVAARIIDVAVVGRSLGLSPLEARQALQPALDDGLLVTESGALTFAHDLVRDAIVESVPLVQRARMHAALAGAIEVVHGEDLAAHVEELADNLFEAAGGAPSERAFVACMAAADSALSRLAFDQAALHRSRALQLLPAGDSSRETRWDVLIKLAAERRFSGDVEGASESVRQAISTARRIGQTDLLRRTLLLLGSPTLWNWRHFGEVDGDVVAELRQLSAAPESQAERALLLGTLAVELYFAGDPDECVNVAAAAVDLARTTGDDSVLSRTLNNLMVASFFPGREALRLSAARETLQLAQIPPATEAVALIQRGYLQVQRGDVAAGVADFDRAGWLVPRLGLPELEGQLACSLAGMAIVRGDLAAAEEDIDQELSMFRRTTLWGAEFTSIVQRLQIGRLTGRLDAVLPDLVDSAMHDTNRIFRWPAVVAMAEVGEVTDARRHISRWGLGVDGPFLHWASDWEWTQAAEAALLLNLPTTRALYDRLVPQQGGMAMVGTASAVLGPYDALLARLARASGDEAAAARHADRADQLVRRVRDGLGQEPHFTLR
ncbi:BTAD domain-containing putative transcriptional regulator [Subtercola sp. YIM 133946]|uniref:BTAD domain-containing putative transcriptional regulator n=1 Tax=Subtercola sp. YIM 133946 TaxID=3118909 RepID=UPI002F92AC0B